jgi:hypothetical protein
MQPGAGKMFHEGKLSIGRDMKNGKRIGNYASGGREGQAVPTEPSVSWPRSSHRVSTSLGTTGARCRCPMPPTPPSWQSRSIRRWWERLGRTGFRKATKLMITADTSGSNDCWVRACKYPVRAAYDPNCHPTGQRVSDNDHYAIPLVLLGRHGKWTHGIAPAA